MTSSTSDLVLLNQLQELTSGLFWVSEIDAEFEIFHLEQATISLPQLLEYRHLPSHATVETETIDDFFRVAVKEESWHGPEEKAEVKRYQALLSTLKNNLDHLLVYSVGEVEIDILIIGCSGSNQLIGLSTKAVKT